LPGFLHGCWTSTEDPLGGVGQNFSKGGNSPFPPCTHPFPFLPLLGPGSKFPAPGSGTLPTSAISTPQSLNWCLFNILNS
jgi:hypothetical protein